MSRPWMPLYIADYLAKTAHLGALQSGAYLHLIMHYWDSRGLPEDEAALARIARLTPSEWRRERATLAAFFHDGWKHSRIDEELAHADEVSSKRRASAEQRHNKRSANASANAEQMEPHTRASSQPPSRMIADDARERDTSVSKDEEYELRLVAGKALNQTSAALMAMPTPMAWKRAGYDWMLDVIPAIRDAAPNAREGSVKTWNYFTSAIVDWHAKRTAPMPRAAPVAPTKQSASQGMLHELKRIAANAESPERDSGPVETLSASDYRRTG